MLEDTNYSHTFPLRENWEIDSGLGQGTKFHLQK